MLIADTADRSLVRRFNFLGFPGEKKGEALTYAGLRAELGDEHASALVVRVGVLAKVHHLDQLGVGIDGAVARMIQSMTADERRSAAQSGTLPPRVEAMITAEAEAAKLQQKQTGTGPNSGTGDPSLSPTHLAGLGAFGFGASRGLLAQGDGSRASSTTSGTNGNSYGSMPGYSGNITNPEFLHSMGLSNSTGSALASLGYTKPEQVRALVRDANTLKIDTDKGTRSLGELKHYDSKNYVSHMNFFSHTYATGLDSLKEMDGQIAIEADPVKKAMLQTKRDEAARQLETQAAKQESKIAPNNAAGHKAFRDTKSYMNTSRGLRDDLGPDAVIDSSREQTRAAVPESELKRQDQKRVKDEIAVNNTDDAALLAGIEEMPGGDKSPAQTRRAEVEASDESALPTRRDTLNQKVAGNDPSKSSASESNHAAENDRGKPNAPAEPKQAAKADGVKSEEPKKPIVEARQTKAPAAPSIA